MSDRAHAAHGYKEQGLNLKEGLRRTGLVLGGFVTIFTLAVYGVSDAPSKSSVEYSYKNKIVAHVYDKQTPEYRASKRDYAMADEIWGDVKSGELIDTACRQSVTNGLAALCDAYKVEVSGLSLTWAKHILLTLLAAMAASAVFGLLWWSFSWVLLGFTQPKDQQPNH